jgi:hypothetical protein
MEDVEMTVARAGDTLILKLPWKNWSLNWKEEP